MPCASPSLGTQAITVTSMLVLLAAIVTSYLDRMLDAQKAVLKVAQQGEVRFRMISEARPLIVLTARPDGTMDYYNRRWYDFTGLSEAESAGWGWKSALSPEDLPRYLEAWEQALRTGESLEGEYRLRGKNGAFRWHLARATPVKDANGEIEKWLCTCTDIEDQKHHQQILEEQVQKHTAALVEANARLTEEIRTLAQQELNEQSERMVVELTRRTQRAALLAKMAELLQICSDLKEVFSIVIGMAPKIFPELRGAILLLNRDRKLLELVGAWEGCQLPAADFEAQECWALRTGRSHFVEAGDPTAECAHVHDSKFSYLCIPIQAQTEAVGTLHFQLVSGRTISEAELALTGSFAEQVGLSMANIKLREALRTQSIRDSLTGLYNRHYMEETLEREIRRAARVDSKLGVILLDIDHFKNFNDTYGHEAGDSVLRELGAFLTIGIRAEDVACRFGGEEFVAILPTADLDATCARAERLRSKLKDLTVLHYGKSLGTITVSVGVAEFPSHGSNPRELLAAADAALYEAKRGGRDRVVRAKTVSTAHAAVAAGTAP
jgi:diguanylate cyclase (GGDEF)-like protein/PAS domain S-box-containing protein